MDDPEKFKPEKFKDTYRSDLRRRVQQKIRKKQTHAVDVEEPAQDERPKAEVIDLMEALKSSLAKNKGKGGGGRHPARRATTAKTSKRA